MRIIKEDYIFQCKLTGDPIYIGLVSESEFKSLLDLFYKTGVFLRDSVLFTESDIHLVYPQHQIIYDCFDNCGKITRRVIIDEAWMLTDDLVGRGASYKWWVDSTYNRTNFKIEPT